MTTVKNSNLISQHIHIPNHNVVQPKLTHNVIDKLYLNEAGEKKRERGVT